MHRNYKSGNKILACVLLITLFLQSCDGFQNQVTPQGKKWPSRKIALSDHLSMNTDKKIVTSDGYLASFYEEDGELRADLKADEEQPTANYKGVPVLVEEGTNLTSLTKLDSRTQKSRIELNRSRNGQLKHITIRKGGLSGGMMQEDTAQMVHESIPHECFCPITQEIIEDPVIAYDGHTYDERIAIQSWFGRGRSISPKTGVRLISTELVPNYTMRSMIQNFKAQIPVLARHKLNMNNVEAAIKIREDYIQQELELKNNLLQQAKQKPTLLENQLGELHQETKERKRKRKREKEKEKEGDDSCNRINIRQIIKLIFKIAKEKFPCWEILSTKYQISENDSREALCIAQNNLLEELNYRCNGNNICLSRAIEEAYRKELIDDKEKEAYSKIDAAANEAKHLNLGAPLSKLTNINNFGARRKKAKKEYYSKAEKQFQRGLCYELGQGVTRDYQVALKYYHKAAKQGKVIAKARLARMYHNGWGLKKDRIKSNEILQEICEEIKKGAEQRNKEYQFMLGWMYYNDQGVAQDYQKAFEWFQKAADQGHAVAQNKLGWMYYNGQGLTQDYQKAFEWFQKATDQGLVYAQYNLGWMYLNGLGVGKDYQKALAWYQKAADQGNADVQYNLGLMYQNGQGITQDYQKAMEWFQKAADQGHAIAQNNLGLMYDNGQGVAQDYHKAMEWFQKAAEQGYAMAQNNLGLIYYNGQGVAQNYQKALEWFQKAADQGHAVAQNNLGSMYYNGQGVTQSYQKALEWFQKAADQGRSVAQNNLGLMYDNHQGVAQDYHKAVECFQKAADQGDTDAQNNLGSMYYTGQGVTQSYQKAVIWFQKAADQGNADAQNNLGSMYYTGQSVTQNYQRAMEWFQKAAEQGHTDAQNNLGLIYYTDQGVTQNYQKALEWFQKATDQGHAMAQNNLGSMYYTGQGVTQNYQRAAEWSQKAADQGHVVAQNNLGSMYYTGQGVAQNYQKALEWFQKAADQGYAVAQNNLGLMYKKGQGVAQNPQKALGWFQKAANQGYKCSSISIYIIS